MAEPVPPTELGRLRVLSSTAGVRVSPLQLGAMSIGEAWAGMMGSMNKESAFKLLDAFYEAGGNFIDTANVYQNEQSEQWIGEWVEARQNRDSLVLATKFTMDYRSHAIGKGPQAANFAGNSRHSIHVGVRDSLKKLRTDYIGKSLTACYRWPVSSPCSDLCHLCQISTMFTTGISPPRSKRSWMPYTFSSSRARSYT